MDIKEFSLYDKDFNESMFLSFVNNVFVKIFTAIMTDKLSTVKHYMNDETYAYCQNIISMAQAKNARHMYDELNVWNSKIQSVNMTDEEYIVKVTLNARYMEYLLDLDNANIISGSDKSRIVVPYTLTFKKKKNNLGRSVIPKCTYCGASIDIYNNGICPYCRGTYETKKHDYVLCNIKNI